MIQYVCYMQVIESVCMCVGEYTARLDDNREAVYAPENI